MQYADAKKVDEIVRKIDRSLIDTRKRAIEAQALGMACAAYIAKIPGADTVEIAPLIQTIQLSGSPLSREDQFLRQQATKAIYSIREQALAEKQKSAKVA